MCSEIIYCEKCQRKAVVHFSSGGTEPAMEYHLCRYHANLRRMVVILISPLLLLLWVITAPVSIYNDLRTKWKR